MCIIFWNFKVLCIHVKLSSSFVSIKTDLLFIQITVRPPCNSQIFWMKWMKGQGHSQWNKKIEKYTYGLALVAMVLFFIWLCSWVGLQRPSEIQAFSIRVHKILAKLKLKWATSFSRWPASNRGSDRRTPVDIKVHRRPLQGYGFDAKKFPGAASKIRPSFVLFKLLIVQHV